MNENNYEIVLNKDFVNIRYYIKIIDISFSYICILLRNNILIKIYGTNLIINKMDEYELTIKGLYRKIDFDIE